MKYCGCACYMYVPNFSAIRLGKKYPQNIFMLRYEDLCLDPYGTLDKLIGTLNYQPNHKLIDKILKTFTGKSRSGEQIDIVKAIHNDPMGFVKKSSIKAFDWKEKISDSLLKEIEGSCEKSMAELGYAKWNMDNEEILIKSSEEVWPFSK